MLVSHGSRDPRAAQGLERLVAQVQAFLKTIVPTTTVLGGVLELGTVPLHQQIINDVMAASTSPPEPHKAQSWGIMPLFLQPGNHVQDDLPQEMAIVQTQYPTLALTLYPYVGQGEPWLQWVRSQLDPTYTWICLAHGTRRPAAQDFFTQLHQRLGSQAAYASHPPHLEDALQKILASGAKKVGILPYFLFPGRIPDQIQEQLQTLQVTYPQIEWRVLPLLGDQDGCAEAIVSTWHQSIETLGVTQSQI